MDLSAASDIVRNKILIEWGKYFVINWVTSGRNTLSFRNN